MGAPGSGFVSEWHSLGDVHLVLDNNYSDEEALGFMRNTVAKRLQWLAHIPSRLKQLHQENHSSKMHESVDSVYVNSRRLKELRTIKHCKYDLTKLICLCEELDRCWRSGCLFATIVLTRAIIDHVPPIFQCNTFLDVANQYAGTKSFKDQMLHLHNSCRKIADQHLHCSIRNSETLPTTTQVNFSNDVDVLLAEIVRLLKQ